MKNLQMTCLSIIVFFIILSSTISVFAIWNENNTETILPRCIASCVVMAVASFMTATVVGYFTAASFHEINDKGKNPFAYVAPDDLNKT